MLKMLRATIMLAATLAVSTAYGQSTLLQGGPYVPGHAPMYVGQGSTQPIVQDSGTAAGGPLGVGLSELGVASRSPTNTYPAANTGLGPLYSHVCYYDGPTTNPTGYHALCFDPNAQGGGLISYSAGGGASTLPLAFNINGASYQFPFVTGGIVGPSTTVVGHGVVWNNTTGTLVADSGGPSVSGPASATTGHIACWNNTSATLLSDCGAIPTPLVGGPASAVNNDFSTFNGTTGAVIKDSGFSASQFYPRVANLTGLQGLASTLYPRVVRGGYATDGDGGYAEYTPTTTACTLNAGAGDGGSQVSSSDGKCWIIDPTATPLNPYQFGALGNDSHDDAPAFTALNAAAIRLNVNVTWGKAPSRWRWGSQVTINYQSVSGTNWTINADGADIDATPITSTPFLQIQCGVTSGQDTADCQGLTIRGKLQIRGATTDFGFILGKYDLSDVNQSVIIEDMLVANGSANPGAGGCQFNFPTTDHIRAICDTQGGGGINAHGIAAGAEITAASMNIFALSASAGGCLLSGTCTNTTITQRAQNILFADPIFATGSTAPPTNVSDVVSGGDTEIGPSCYGVTAQSFYANTINSQYFACFSSLNVSLPVQAAIGGSVTAADTITLTATSLAGSPAVTVTAAGGDTVTTLAQKLVTAINANSTMAADGVYGTSSGATVLLSNMSGLMPKTTWTRTITGSATETVTFTTATGVGGNVWIAPMVQGQPSWVLGSATGFELAGQGATANYRVPYGSAYTVDGLNSNGLISSFNASAGAPQVVTKLAANVASGGSSVVVANATGIVSGMNVAGLGVPSGVTTGSPSGTTIPLVGGTMSAAEYTGVPIAFTPASSGAGGTTLTATLPDCNLVNGGKDWRVGFMAENSNPLTIATVNSQQIVSDGVAASGNTITIKTNYDFVNLHCTGSLWLIEAASAKVLADNNFGVRQTWTPVLKFGANGETATNTGTYTVFNKTVTAEFQLALTAKVGTGAATVTGLPIAANGTGSVVCPYGGGMLGLTAPVQGYIQGTTITFDYWGTTGVGGLTDANFTTTSNQLNCTATYIVQ